MLLFANELYLTSFYNKGLAIASHAGMYPRAPYDGPGEAVPERVTLFQAYV